VNYVAKSSQKVLGIGAMKEGGICQFTSRTIDGRVFSWRCPDRFATLMNYSIRT
jgi:hypothetical protein